MKQINLLMRNNFKELAALMNQASTFLESESLPEAAVYKAHLVLEEVLTNIIKYAFEDAAEHEISVVLAVNDIDLMIRFVDDGREFDPLAVPLPVMKESIQEITVGGLGVHLVRNSVNSMEYRREQAKNVLETRIGLRT